MSSVPQLFCLQGNFKQTLKGKWQKNIIYECCLRQPNLESNVCQMHLISCWLVTVGALVAFNGTCLEMSSVLSQLFTVFHNSEETSAELGCTYECLPTYAELPNAAPASADRAQHVSSSGLARSLAGPAVPAHNTALSGCIPQASNQTVIGEETEKPWV